MLGLNLRNRFVPTRDSTNLGARRTRPRDTPTPPTTPMIENENPLVQASQEESWLFRSCSQSENTDNRIALFTPPSQRTPATERSPTPDARTNQRDDAGRSPSPTPGPQTPRTPQLLSLSSLLLPPFSPLPHESPPTPTATASVDGPNTAHGAQNAETDIGSTVSVGAPPPTPPSLCSYAP